LGLLSGALLVRRPTALGAIRAVERRLQLRPKQLELDHQRQPLERVPGR
jgi:hypothetical protein